MQQETFILQHLMIRCNRNWSNNKLVSILDCNMCEVLRVGAFAGMADVRWCIAFVYAKFQYSRKPLKMICFCWTSLKSVSLCASLKDSSQTFCPTVSSNTTPPDSTWNAGNSRDANDPHQALATMSLESDKYSPKTTQNPNVWRTWSEFLL